MYGVLNWTLAEAPKLRKKRPFSSLGANLFFFFTNELLIGVNSVAKNGRIRGMLVIIADFHFVMARRFTVEGDDRSSGSKNGVKNIEFLADHASRAWPKIA